MKKSFLQALCVFLILIFSLSLISCDKGSLSYFNSFTSTDGFSVAEKTLELPEGTTVSTRFNDGFYSIKKQIQDSSLYSYGLCTDTEIIIDPTISTTTEYHPYDFADVTDKYVVAVKSATNGSSSIVTQMGAYALKDLDNGKKIAVDMVNFQYYVPTTTVSSSDTTKVIDEDSMPIKIVGDYICLLQDKDNPVKNDATLKGATYHTFYSYDGTGLKYAFSITGSSYKTVYDIFDDYLVRYDNYSSTYETYLTISYYKISSAKEGESLTPIQTYSPYTETEITSIFASCSSSADKNVEIDTYYLGNGAFLRKKALFCSETFENYNLRITKYDCPFGYDAYVLMESDRISIKDTLTTYNNANVFPYEVVNKYNDSSMRDLADYYNNSLPVTSEKTGNNPIYQYPYYSTASLIGGDYSIVYTYWQPYLGDTSLSLDDQKLASISFIIYDNKDFTKKILVEDAIMPIVNIDGIGLETYSLNFSDVLVMDAEVFDGKTKKTIDASTNILDETDTTTLRYSYKSYIYHDGILLVGENNLLGEAEVGYKKGAYKYKNGAFTQITEYEFDELTPFFDGYATGAKWNTTSKTTTYYVVADNGEIKELSSNVYALHNGCYVSRTKKSDDSDDYYYALFSNNPDTPMLIDYNADALLVYEEFLQDGEFVKTTVIKRVGDHDEIYILK